MTKIIKLTDVCCWCYRWLF